MANTLKFGNGQWATKVGSTLAYNDENGNFKPLPFNFTRSTSATRVNKDGLIEVVTNNKPRIDFLNDSNGALLLEPTRTNSFQQSNQFDTTWTKSSGVTITSEQAISPDGNNNGWKFEKTAASYKSIGQGYTLSSETTFSIFAKKGTLSIITLFANISGGTNLYQIFDLENGTLSSGAGMSSSNIENYGNGWYRCSSTFTNASVTSLDLFPEFSENNAGYIYIYGAQVEAGSYATSYIPTQGAISTRVGDACNNAGNDQLFNNLEGVLYIEADILKTSGTGFLMSISNGNFASLSESINIRQQSSGTLSFQLSSAGSNTFVDTTDWSEGINKIALRYNSSGINVYINGNSKGTNSAITYPNINNLDLASRPDQVGQLIEKLKVKDVRVYNTSLTDAELISLTS